MTNMIVCSITSLLPNTATRYLTLTGSVLTTQTAFLPFTACTLKKFRVYVASQGAGVVDHTLTIRKNGAGGETLLTLKILAADAKPKLYTVSADVAVAEDDLLDIISTPDAGGASTYTLQWSTDFL